MKFTWLFKNQYTVIFLVLVWFTIFVCVSFGWCSVTIYYHTHSDTFTSLLDLYFRNILEQVLSKHMRYEYFIQNKWLFLQLDPYKCLSMFILGWNHSVKFDKIQANINTQITLHTSAKLIITLVFDADMPTFPSGAYFYICFLFNVCGVLLLQLTLAISNRVTMEMCND